MSRTVCAATMLAAVLSWLSISCQGTFMKTGASASAAPVGAAPIAATPEPAKSPAATPAPTSSAAPAPMSHAGAVAATPVVAPAAPAIIAIAPTTAPAVAALAAVDKLIASPAARTDGFFIGVAILEASLTGLCLYMMRGPSTSVVA